MEVVKGFLQTKDLICCIIAVLLLLSVCMTIDYADDAPIKIIKNQSKYNGTSLVKVQDNQSIVIVKQKTNTIIPKATDRVYSKYPIIGMYAKPSVRSGYSYKWHYKEFIDYCPHCHHYHALLKNPKGVPEREYTCKYCGADYCAVTGKEKYSWSHYYLRRA